MDLSIVVPTTQDRGVLLPGLASWLQQRGPADAYQIILALAAPDEALEAWFAARARPQDRVLRPYVASDPALYNAAAAAATGRWLFLTESHVMAHPDSVAVTREALAAGPPCSLSLGGRAWGASRFARFMGRSYELDMAAAQVRHPWHNVMLRGVALPAESYAAVGGMAETYGLFSAVHLGMKLAEHGLPARQLAGPWLSHAEDMPFDELAGLMRGYGQGERLARAAEPALLQKYLPRRRPMPAPVPAPLLTGLARLLEQPWLPQPVYEATLRRYRIWGSR